MKRKGWTPEEIKALKNEYPKGKKEKILSKLLGRTWMAVCLKASKLGIKREEFTWRNSKPKVTFTCLVCNSVETKYDNPNSSHKFCSREHYYQWLREHPEENYFHKYPRYGELNGNWGRHPNHHKNLDMRELSLLGRLAQGPQRLTKPEKKLYEILNFYKIQFESQKYIGSYCVDAFIEPNTILEVDGEYWHNYPHGKKTDAKRDKELQESGYKVHRYWANDILNNGQEELKWLPAYFG